MWEREWSGEDERWRGGLKGSEMKRNEKKRGRRVFFLLDMAYIYVMIMSSARSTHLRVQVRSRLSYDLGSFAFLSVPFLSFPF